MADKELSTEDEILDKIIEDDANGFDQTTGDEDSGDEEESPTVTTKETKSKEDKQNDSTGGKSTQGKPPGKSTANPQDLVVNGVVVAKAGAERRHYETAQNFKRQLEDITKKYNEVAPLVQAYEKVNTTAKEYGFTPQDQVTAFQLLKAYKDDPAATLKYLLTQAQAGGIDVGELGAGGVSPTALKQMLAEALKPFQEERDNKLNLERVNREATDQYNRFVSQYPDAVIHNDTIAALLEKHPEMSPETAYYKVKTFFLEKGLDFSKTLEENEQMLKQTQGGKTQERRGLPAGNTALQDDEIEDASHPVTVNTSMDDIIRQALREGGISR